MIQQPDPTPPTPDASVPASMIPLVQSLGNLFQEVRDMAPGGDLEGLIETHLSGLNRQGYDTALSQRAQAAAPKASGEPEAFPPWGPSQVSEAAAPGAFQAARDSDAAR